MPIAESLRWYRSQLAQRAALLRGPLAVAMVHRVCERGDHGFLQDGGVPFVTPGCFRAQMRFLVERGFRVLSGAEVCARFERGGAFEPRSVWITFDDGFLDNRAAAEVLAELGLTATFFVATDCLRRDALLWEHRLFAALACLGPAATRALAAGLVPDGLAQGSWVRHAVRELAPGPRAELGGRLSRALADADVDEAALARALYLAPEDALAMRELGMELASHGAAHLPYTTLDRAGKERDLDAAAAALRELLGDDVPPIFSSPYGSHGPADRDLLRARGYRVATTDRLGTNRRRADPLLLRRLSLGDETWYRLRFLDRTAALAGRLDGIR